MTQIIYAVSALAVLTLFSFTMQRAGLNTERDMYVTEARTRMLGIARETVERISRMEMPFDEATDPARGAKGKVYPYVNSPNELTAAGSFGGAAVMSDGLDMDDYDDMSIAFVADGIPCVLDFEIAYVDTLTGDYSANATFAKRLTVNVSTTAISFNGVPITVSYSRVFSYPNVIDFARGIKSRPPQL